MDCVILYSRPEVERSQFFWILFHLCNAGLCSVLAHDPCQISSVSAGNGCTCRALPASPRRRARRLISESSSHLSLFQLDMPASCITRGGEHRCTKPCNSQHGNRVGNDFNVLEELILEKENTYLCIYLSVYFGVNPTNIGGRR